ncbi:MAG: DUF4861 domain-containing protein [Muribaculaceae bacterium]|nr:DUF4861 domain-containing protein [Muribaculaceae bacterium]
MKKQLTLIVAAGMALTAGAATKTLEITVANQLPDAIESYPVVVPVDVKALGFNPSAAVATVKGTIIPSQLDDIDLDGVVDEISLTVSLPARGKTVVKLALDSEGSQETFPIGTHAYIKLRDEKKKYPKIVSIAFPGDADTRIMYNSIYGHGAVMENPYNAIRIYMDNRQSIDLYGKNRPGMELETTGFYTTQEQLAQGYGRDILWAGKSVGAGSFRGFIGDEPTTIDTVTVRGQRVVLSGPVRSVVEVTDEGWIYNGRRFNMTQRYTMWQGRRDVQVDINITGEGVDSQTFCAGIQKLETDNVGFLDAATGLAGSWGVNVPEKKYEDQTEVVGLGIIPDAANLASTREDEFNYLDMLKTDTEGAISYRVNFAAGREEGGFSTSTEWFDYLRRWAAEAANPATVTVKIK